MKNLDTFKKRLEKIGIYTEYVMNFPWIYLTKVNGITITEKLSSDYSFTVAFSPIKQKESLVKFTDLREIFKVLRKYDEISRSDEHIESCVNNFWTTHEQGFIKSELNELIKQFPHLNKEFFDNAMYGNSVITINGNIITYPWDIKKALRCGVQNRNETIFEMD